MRRRGLLIFLVVLAGVLSYAIYILKIAGQFKSIEPHFDGHCTLVPGVPGPEDIAALSDRSGVFISSQDRRAHLVGGDARGAVYYLDTSRPDAHPVNLTPDAPGDFRPHGIGLYESDTTRLFVVNHPRGDMKGDLPGQGPAHSIEIFDFTDDPPTLAHIRTVAGPALVTPNDVAPVGPEQFYATNDHGTGDKRGRMLEDYLRLARSHLVFFDGAKFTRLPGDYRYANGIIASRDGRRVYLGASTDRTVYVFDRDQASNALSLADSIFVDTAVDNLDIDAAGDIWLGAHPKMLTFMAHAKDAGVPSPSQVLRISPQPGRGHAVEEVFLSDGRDLSSSTVAVRIGRRLLIGSVFAPGYFDCQMSQPAAP